MFHWQWFILFITIFFVVSNGGERIRKKRTSAETKKVVDPLKKFSTNVNFPLWVSIKGLGSFGANTQFKNISDNLYEFTLPFMVIVRQSDVLVNRSSKQDENLGFPFWVKISDPVEGFSTYDNETFAGTMRLSFPFDLEVAKMVLSNFPMQLQPETRKPLVSLVAGTIGLVGKVALGACFVCVAVCGVVVAHVIRGLVVALWQSAVSLFRPQVPGVNWRANTAVGKAIQVVTGAVMFFVPGFSDVVKEAIVRMFATCGDFASTIIYELSNWHAVGDSFWAVRVIAQMFAHIPYRPRIAVGVQPPRVFPPPPTYPSIPGPPFPPIYPPIPGPPFPPLYPPIQGSGHPPSPPIQGSGHPPYPPIQGSGHPPSPPIQGSGHPPSPPIQGSGYPPSPPIQGSGYPPPPIITPPEKPQAPPEDNNNVFQITIFYGQETIPGFPGYIIVWPGKQEPPTTDYVIVRPIVPTLPMRPHIKIVWPVQSRNPSYPNVILIQPEQRIIPGYINVLIVWPGQPKPVDSDLIIVEANQETIPFIEGVVLLWPGVPPKQGPHVITLQPNQRQHPQFPTIIFMYPNDPNPPTIPGIIVVKPPQVNIPQYPSITIVWPGGPPPPSNLPPIRVGPTDFQIPGLPNFVIINAGQQTPPPTPGVIFVLRGQTSLPGHPEIRLTWLQEEGPPPVVTTTIIYIPPMAQSVPGFGDFKIRRPEVPQIGVCSVCVSPGDKVLPNNPNVQLLWLEMPSALVLEPSPDIYTIKDIGSSYIGRRKRSIGKSSARLNDINENDVFEGQFGWQNSTFDYQRNVYGAHLDKRTFSRDMDLYKKSWKYGFSRGKIPYERQDDEIFKF